jgi:chitin synthase
MAAIQGGQAIEMREQGSGLMGPRIRSISPQGPQAPAPAAALAHGSQPPPTNGKSKKERKKLSKTRPGSSGSGQ